MRYRNWRQRDFPTSFRITSHGSGEKGGFSRARKLTLEQRKASALKASKGRCYFGLQSPGIQRFVVFERSTPLDLLPIALHTDQ